MKKNLLAIIFLIFGFIRLEADILPLLKYSVSDLIIAGFEVIDVTAANRDEVIYTLKMKKLDSKMVKYPPLVMCIAKPQSNFLGCYDLR
jgi:hypothetical protein